MAIVAFSIIGVVATTVALVGFTAPELAQRAGRSSSAPSTASNVAEEISEELRAQLENLGYIGATKVRDPEEARVGVTIDERESRDDGLAIYTPCGWGRRYREAGFGAPKRETRLIDSEGRVLHQWKNSATGGGRRGWANAKIGPDGSLYVVHARTSLTKLEWDSNILWTVEGGFHHDLEVHDDGSVVVLVEERRTIEYRGKRINLLDNGIAFVSPSGAVEKTLWFYDIMRDHPLFLASLEGYFTLARRTARTRKLPRSGSERRKLRRFRRGLRQVEKLGHRGVLGGIDLFHANTVEITPTDRAGRWSEGDILTSFRNLDTVAVFDHRTGALRWHWGRGELHRQHDPSILPNGNLLVFDNQSRSTGSRVVEVESESGEILWSYEGTEDEPFYSHTRGGAQLLKNGNILITSSQSARAFEVDRDEEIVWEFYGHDIRRDHRVPIRMTRLRDRELRWIGRRLQSFD